MKKILPFLVLILVVFGVYAPALRNEFVWDDTALVLRDPLIRSWRLIPEGFQHFLFLDATASDFYRPIQRLTYVFDYACFGFRPAGYHFTSIVWHALAAVALLLFAWEFLRLFNVEERKARILALAAALVWTIHPLQTSAVAYVSGRADPLAAAFGFAGLYFAVRSLRATGRQAWPLTFAAAVFFLLSALSKESGLIFPVLWLALIALRKNREASLRTGIAILSVAVFYLSLRLPAEHFPAPPPAHAVPTIVRPILVARAYAEYVGLVALPVNLRMERDVETHPRGFSRESMSGASWKELQTLAGAILIAAFIYWMWRERKRDRAVFSLLVLSGLSYLPVSGVVPLNATLAEHWLYVPLGFLALALTLVCARLFQPERPPVLKPLVIGAVSLWILFLGARTFLRTLDWKDQRTFLSRTIAGGGNSPRMLINLAGLEMNEGRFDDARKNLQTALQKEPDQPLAVSNLAALAIKQNDFKAAHEFLERATKMPLVEAQAYEMLAVLENKETGHANLLRVRLAARTGPENWAIEKRYIKVLDESGATGAAIEELRRCLVTEWYRAESWALLSELLTKAGRNEDAAQALDRARRYDVRLSERTARS